MSTGPRVVVVGAGAFGGWTALELARRGARVTLVDAWGPGHARASSGGETRVIRATYGADAIYTAMSARALGLWRAHERRWGCELLRPTGAIWMFSGDDSYGRASARTLRDHGLPVEEWTPGEAAQRYPQIDFTGIRSALFEPGAGYLFARRACEQVARQVVNEGGHYRVAAVESPVRVDGNPLAAVTTADASRLEADAFVFACGPWLGSLFPDAVGDRVSVTKQDVFYFGTPAGDARFDDPALPVWLELGERQVYGIPGNAYRGLKVADDHPGPRFDPTTGAREVAPDAAAAARRALDRRFPTLAGAPLIGTEVCQYESTPDAGFIIDRHPAAANVWIAGGGSGHGFKMGPAIGERLAALVLGQAETEPAFSLRRFDAPPPGGWRPKWSS